MLPALMVNGLLRLALIVWVLAHQGWALGDTGYFLAAAKSVCAGEWGSDSFRTPLYPWLICGLSWGGIGSVLVLQNLLVWGSGLYLYHNRSKQAAVVWVWDPVVFVYSFLVMSDLIFGVMLLGFGLLMWTLLGNQPKATAFRTSVAMGALTAGLLLQRPAAMTLVGFSFVFLLVCVALKRVSWRSFIVLFLVTATLLSPRLFWMHQRYDRWALSTEAANLIQATAGAVVYHDQGMGLYEGEGQWAKDHPQGKSSGAVQALVSYFPTFFKMSVRGGLRTGFGHVNVELYQLITGLKIEGPGWFKSKDNRDQNAFVVSSGPGLIVWALGLAGTAIWAVCLHGLALISSTRLWASSRAYVAWALGMITLAIITPQLWGDARFRIPIVALEIVILSISRIHFFSRKRLLNQTDSIQHTSHLDVARLVDARQLTGSV